MMMDKFKMYVVTHKEIPVKLPENYIPIQVGKCNTKLELHYITDDTGDNISKKNANFCELTALYWIWKNCELPDYVGLCHYRRYLVGGLFSAYLNEKKVIKEMRDYDVILPEVHHTNTTVYEYYIQGSGVKKDIDNLRTIVEKNYNEYIIDYDYIMNSENISYCNMCVMNKKDFSNYCEWLFDILFKLEKVTDLTGYTDQEKRIYGYLSELLLNVWIRHNNLKVKHYKVFYAKESKVHNILSKIKIAIRGVRA